MSVFKKIMTAIRGGAREAGEAIVDANAIRILEQEIRDAEDHMRKAKSELTGVMAKQMQANREVERLRSEVTKHENYAAQALQKGDEGLALEIAEKIASIENDLSEQEASLNSFTAHANKLKELVKKSERIIKDHNRQLSMVKTTESVQKATAAITDSFASTNSKVSNAKDSLDRIKQRQQDFEDRLKASQELADEESDKNLTDRMAALGIGEQSASGQSVLDRIKAKQQS